MALLFADGRWCVFTSTHTADWFLSSLVDVKLCREKAERNQTACQHFHNRLLVRK